MLLDITTVCIPVPLIFMCPQCPDVTLTADLTGTGNRSEEV